MLPNHHHIFQHVYIAIQEPSPLERDDNSFIYFEIDSELQYHSFCDDFGPVNLSSVYRFCQVLRTRLRADDEKLLALTVSRDASSLTNAAFLLGAFMILELGEEPATVRDSFQAISHLLLSYRDISPGPQNFELHLHDCWEALQKARELEWVDFGPDGFDAEEYDHYDDPLNADLHFIVPNKIIAMKGPSTLVDGERWHDTPEGWRSFSVEHYAEIIQDFDVQLVLRLNQPEYADDEFKRHNIAVVDLFFEDCTLPSHEVVIKFLLITENLPGAVAVHCKAGLGRTGTLIALYIMKNFGFTARQAIGWLRIVRPGSVIGSQQQYLCDLEPSISRLRGHPLTGPFAATVFADPLANLCDVAEIRMMAAHMCALVEEGQRRSLSGHAIPDRTRSAPGAVLGSAQKLAEHVTRTAGRRNSFRALVPRRSSESDGFEL